MRGLMLGRMRGLMRGLRSVRLRWRRRLCVCVVLSRRGIGCGVSLITIDPRTLRITFTILLYFTLGSLAVVTRGLASDIGERVVIVGRVVVIIVSRFTFTIALLIRDGYTWSQGLAVRNRKVRVRGTRFSLSNVLADSYLDALVSKRTRKRRGLLLIERNA